VDNYATVYLSYSQLRPQPHYLRSRSRHHTTSRAELNEILHRRQWRCSYIDQRKSPLYNTNIHYVNVNVNRGFTNSLNLVWIITGKKTRDYL